MSDRIDPVCAREGCNEIVTKKGMKYHARECAPLGGFGHASTRDVFYRVVVKTAPEQLSTNEMADKIGVTRASLMRWHHAGMVPAEQSAGGAFVFLPSEVEAAMKKHGLPRCQKVSSVLARERLFLDGSSA